MYLAIIALGMFGELHVRAKLIVPGDASATAHAIAASPQLWRAGIVGDLLMHVLDVPVILILYVLLRPVSKNLALLATLVNLVATAIFPAVLVPASVGELAFCLWLLFKGVNTERWRQRVSP